MRIVLDTNVVLSGVATRGICDAVIDYCVKTPDCVLILSQHIIGEFVRQYQDKFGMTADEAKAAVAFLRQHAEMVEPQAVPPGSCRDADDLPVLGTALAGKADCLVTGDKDLLALRQFQGVPILSPREFYERLQK